MSTSTIATRTLVAAHGCSEPTGGSDRRLLSTEEAATVLSVQPCTLEKWRHIGRGPAFRKIGRLVRYCHADIESFITESRRLNTAEANGKLRRGM